VADERADPHRPEASVTEPRAGPFVVVCGLPGTGKTTLARTLASRLRGTYLGSDVVRHELGLSRRYDDASVERVYGELLRRASLAARGGPVVVDATFSSRRFRVAAFTAATEVGAPLSMVLLEAEPEVARARVTHRRPLTEAGPEAYELLRRSFDPVSLPCLVLDSTATTPGALVEEVVAYLKEQRLSSASGP
jgi:predicted kinase